MSEARNQGATKAGEGRFVFDLGKLQRIKVGGAYSPAEGPVVEGERMQVGLITIPRGTASQPHSHPNEQWIYILEGTFVAEIDGKKVEAKPGSVIYIPSNTIHGGKATADADVVFFTVKDGSYGLQGIKAA